MKYKLLLASVLFTGSSTIINAQQNMKHEDTEFYEPVPKVVTPGKSYGEPPSDAVILFVCIIYKQIREVIGFTIKTLLVVWGVAILNVVLFLLRKVMDVSAWWYLTYKFYYFLSSFTSIQ